MKFAILFPGQGSQFVGMGAELFHLCPELLGDSADEILGWSLRRVCLEGPEETLTRTEFAQPALFALSYALWTLLAVRLEGEPAGAAGHSLGEYTALVAAGVLQFESALAVVNRRGQAMAAASDLEPSGMAALIGVDNEASERIVAMRRADGGRLSVANINAPGQVVVAGSQADITWLMENGRELGARRAIPLKVAGAFHSSFMEPARQSVGSALSDVQFSPAKFPVWANTSGKRHEEARIRGSLERQVVSPVMFSDTLVDMATEGIGTFVHVGPGDVTAGMAKRTVIDSNVITVSTVEDISPAVEAIGTMS